MVKKKIKTQKLKKISIFTLKTSVFNYNLLKTKIPSKIISIYIIISLILIGIINLIRSITGNLSLSPLESFSYTLIGIPLIALFIFTLFFIFLSAFEGKRQEFWHSFGIFLVISMPFLILGHILNWLRTIFPLYNSFISSLIIILMIYFVINLIFQLKNHFNTTALRILASFILVDILIGTLAILEYFSYILLNLK